MLLYSSVFSDLIGHCGLEKGTANVCSATISMLEKRFSVIFLVCKYLLNKSIDCGSVSLCVCAAQRRLWRTLCSHTRQPISPSPSLACLILSTSCSPWAATTRPPTMSWTASSRPSPGKCGTCQFGRLTSNTNRKWQNHSGLPLLFLVACLIPIDVSATLSTILNTIVWFLHQKGLG